MNLQNSCISQELQTALFCEKKHLVILEISLFTHIYQFAFVPNNLETLVKIDFFPMGKKVQISGLFFRVKVVVSGLKLPIVWTYGRKGVGTRFGYGPAAETFFDLYARSFGSSYAKSFFWVMWGIIRRLVAYTMFVVTQL